MVRLVRVTRQDLTITRCHKGKRIVNCDQEGNPVTDGATMARIESLAIPPAWTNVRIAPNPRAHIQALGTDDAGRDQYIYHPDWEKRRISKKQQRLALLTQVLPKLRRKVADDLSARAGSQRLALALAVTLIDRTAMRVGREAYLAANGTRGAGTLFARDVTVKGAAVHVAFRAKGGKRAEYSIVDAKLANAVTRIRRLKGRRLLVYRDKTGNIRPLKTSAINLYLRELTGESIAAKDFRTLHASALAGEALAGLEVGTSISARRRQMAEVTRDVAAVLRNTPMICRKSYIAPCLFRLFDEGKLQKIWAAGGSARAGLYQREQRLGAILAATSEA